MAKEVTARPPSRTPEHRLRRRACEHDVRRTMITIADVQGDAGPGPAAGSMGFKGSRKSTPSAAPLAAETPPRRRRGARDGRPRGRERCVAPVRAVMDLRALQAAGFTVTSIHDVTRSPHNGCWPRKRVASDFILRRGLRPAFEASDVGRAPRFLEGATVIQKNGRDRSGQQARVSAGRDPRAVHDHRRGAPRRGFGVTLGDALRRVLLLVPPGPRQVTSVRIDHVLRESRRSPASVRMLPDLILNIKDLAIHLPGRRPEASDVAQRVPARWSRVTTGRPALPDP